MKNDRSIQRQVQEELHWEPSIEAAEVGVGVHDGIVTITGTVQTFGQKHRAERAAMGVRGVRAVANDLLVDLPTAHEKTDAEIAGAILQTFELNVAVPHDRLTTVVSKGLATLGGEVQWHFQRQAAIRAVRDLTGVKGVLSEIRIAPRPISRDIKERVGAALRRSAQIDADRMSVEVEGQRVTLSGSVASLAEKDLAERAVWAAPGVTAVSNRLTVDQQVSRAP